jgi:hypothetical protein
VVGIDPGIVAKVQAVSNPRADTFKKRGMRDAGNGFAGDAEFVGHEAELLNETPVTGVKAHEQRPSLSDHQRLTAYVQEFFREGSPCRERPALAQIIFLFARRNLAARSDHAGRGPGRTFTGSGVKERNAPTVSSQAKSAGHPDNAAANDERITSN